LAPARAPLPERRAHLTRGGEADGVGDADPVAAGIEQLHDAQTDLAEDDVLREARHGLVSCPGRSTGAGVAPTLD
jgi:hypothetical protein